MVAAHRHPGSSGCGRNSPAQTISVSFQHVALFEIGDERHAGAIHFLGLERDALLDAAVVVPSPCG